MGSIRKIAFEIITIYKIQICIYNMNEFILNLEQYNEKNQL